jgi:hypothetical protein
MKLPARRAVHSEGFLWSGKEFPKQAIPEGICCFPEDNQKSLFARSPKNGSYLIGRKKLFLPGSLSQDISGHKTFDLL